MTTAKVSAVDQDIKERIKSGVPKFQGRVYEGDVPEGDVVPLDPAGYVLPYVTLIYGGAFRTGRRIRGVTSVRDDLKYHTILVLVTAATTGLANELGDEIRDALEGYEPPGASELYEETSGNAKYPADPTLKPVRYTTMLAFSLLLNQ